MRADAGPYRAADMLRACRGELRSGDPHTIFDGISTDSRDIRKNDLFVPLTGPNFDGHDFLLPALEAGARGSLFARDIPREIFQQLSNHVLIQVQDTLRALSDLASAHRKTCTPPLIAVTGSSGKTSVKEMIAGVLGRSHHLLVSEGNFNNMVGLPMTVLNLTRSHTLAVVEAGINRDGEMEYLAKAASPDVAVITTIGPVHLEGLGSVENVAREKFKLVGALPANGTAVLPDGNPYLAPLLELCQCPIVFFGIEDGDYRASNIHVGEDTVFEMVTPFGARKIRLRVPGRHTISNALCAAAACMAVDTSLQEVAEGLEQFTAPAWRMEFIPLSGNRTLIRDCYNANPQSVTVALEVLAHSGRQGKTLALLADMMELGADAERFHEEIGRKAAKLGIDRLIFVGSYGKPFVSGFTGNGGDNGAVTWAPDKEEAWEIVQRDLTRYGVILVKGSRAAKMETIADRILKEN